MCRDLFLVQCVTTRLPHGEEVRDACLLNRRNDTALGRRRNNSHGVALLLEPLELLSHTRTLNRLLAQLASDGAQFLLNVVVHLLRRHLEVVLLLQAVEHTAEVVADKVLKQLLERVALRLAKLLKHLIGQVGAGLEGQALRQTKRVVAVEKDVLDLCGEGSALDGPSHGAFFCFPFSIFCLFVGRVECKAECGTKNLHGPFYRIWTRQAAGAMDGV